MTLPQTMRVLQVSHFGGPDALEQVELLVPQPRAGEVLLKVEAVGLNFADILSVRGEYLSRAKLPFVPGMEFAGTVVQVGEGVTHLEPGQRVAALGGAGGFAEYARVPAGAALPLPANLSAREGAALPVSYYTAYFALHTLGRARAGEWVLIQAAAGALGTASIQLAREMGLHTLALASSEAKLELARSLGAEVALLSGRDDLLESVKAATGGPGVDLLLEVVGGSGFETSLKMLRPLGRLLVIGNASGEGVELRPHRLMYGNLTVTGVWLTPLAQDRAAMGEATAYLAPLLSSGTVRPVVGEVFPLEKAGEAFEFVLSRSSTGKVVLEP